MDFIVRLFHNAMSLLRRVFSYVIPGYKRVTFTSKASKMAKRYLVVGLGNMDRPGTRHSVGQDMVDRLATRLGLKWTLAKLYGGRVASVEVDNQLLLVLLKPTAPMNLNGSSVQRTAKHYDIAVENIYLCHDELDKPLGKLQLKSGGSARGHRGVKSCQNCLKTDVMPRLLIGIGRPATQSQVVNYVLHPFSAVEMTQLPDVLDKAIELLHTHIEQASQMTLNFPRHVG